MIVTKLVDRDAELEGIRSLQSKNLRQNLSDAEAIDQGFLTAEYSLEYLKAMQERHPSVIAVDGDRVVGYALVATQEIREGHPLLSDLFRQIDRLQFRGESLKQVEYVVIGQLCVDKEYRGRGLVSQLYGRFKASLQGRYRYGITDVARKNKRSLQAHLRTGFQVIHTIEYGGQEWDVVLWDWTADRGA